MARTATGHHPKVAADTRRQGRLLEGRPEPGAPPAGPEDPEARSPTEAELAPGRPTKAELARRRRPEADT